MANEFALFQTLRTSDNKTFLASRICQFSSEDIIPPNNRLFVFLLSRLNYTNETYIFYAFAIPHPPVPIYNGVY